MSDKPTSPQGSRQPTRRKQLSPEELKAAPKAVPKKRATGTKQAATSQKPATKKKPAAGKQASAPATTRKASTSPAESADAEGPQPWFAPLQEPAQVASRFFAWLAVAAGALLLLGVLVPVIVVFGEETSTIGFWSATEFLITGGTWLAFAVALCVLPFVLRGQSRAIALAACSAGVTLVALAVFVAVLIRFGSGEQALSIIALSLGFLFALAGSCLVLLGALVTLFAGAPARNMRYLMAVGGTLALVGFALPFSAAGSPLYFMLAGTALLPLTPIFATPGLHSFLAVGVLGLSLFCWLASLVLALAFYRGVNADMSRRLAWGIVALWLASFVLAVAATLALIAGLDQLAWAVTMLKGLALIAGLQLSLVVGFAAFLVAAKLGATDDAAQEQPSPAARATWPQKAFAARLGMGAAVVVVSTLVLAVVSRAMSPEDSQDSAPLFTQALGFGTGGAAPGTDQGGAGTFGGTTSPRGSDSEAQELLGRIHELNEVLTQVERHMRNREFRDAIELARNTNVPSELQGYRRSFEEYRRLANVSLTAEQELNQAVRALGDGDVGFARSALAGIPVESVPHLRSRHRMVTQLAGEVEEVLAAERAVEKLDLLDEILERNDLPSEVEPYLSQMYEDAYAEVGSRWRAKVELCEQMIRDGQIERMRERRAEFGEAPVRWLSQSLLERLSRVDAVVRGEAVSLDDPVENGEVTNGETEPDGPDYMIDVMRALSRQQFTEARALLEEHGGSREATLLADVVTVEAFAALIESDLRRAYVEFDEVELSRSAPQVLTGWLDIQRRVLERRMVEALPETEYAPLYALLEAAEDENHRRVLELAESLDLSVFAEPLQVRAQMQIAHAHFHHRVRRGEASEYRWVELNTHDRRGDTLRLIPRVLDQQPPLFFGEDERGVLHVVQWDEMVASNPYRILDAEEAASHAEQWYEYRYERILDRRVPQRRDYDRANRTITRAQRDISRFETTRDRLQRDYDNALEFAEENHEFPFPDRVQRDLDRRQRRLNDARDDLSQAQRELSEAQAEAARLEQEVQRAIANLRANPPADDRWRIWWLALYGGDAALAQRMYDRLESGGLLSQTYALYLDPAWQRYEHAVARRDQGDAQRAWTEAARRNPAAQPTRGSAVPSLIVMILADIRGELGELAPPAMPDTVDFTDDPIEFDERALNLPSVTIRSASMLETNFRRKFESFVAELAERYTRSLDDKAYEQSEMPMDDLVRYTYDGYCVLLHLLVTTARTADVGPNHDVEELKGQSEERIADLAHRMPPWRD